MIRYLSLLCLTFVLACSPRGQVTVVPDAGAVGEVESVFIGTTRAYDDTGQFGSKRSETTFLGRYDISIPPERELGSIKWPRRGATPDPRVDFLTTSEVRYQTNEAFRADLGPAMRPSGGDAVIFVHGYNNTFSEGLYRIAQLAHDLEMPGAVVHYSWPSAAEPLGYVYDRDSILFARDGLEALIDQVSRAGARRITLVAHSMGSLLTMEALRQIAIRGDSATMNKISGVVLISPDIDVEVFRTQAKAIGKLPQPFLIFGSGKDRMLKLAGLMTGQKERLGTLTDLTRVADLDVTLLDITSFTEGAGHFVLGDSKTLISVVGGIASVGQAFDNDRAAKTDLISGTVLSVQTATRVVLSPVVQIGRELGR
ncbi:MAG: alpha/beta fold hydrolase [Pseudomonadota bacterium]